VWSSEVDSKVFHPAILIAGIPSYTASIVIISSRLKRTQSSARLLAFLDFAFLA
jgi:hypothetical protein